jgi:RNA polymerase sigma-70 factor, ECF subfamily
MEAGKGRDAAGTGGVNLDQAFAQLRPAMVALAYRITGSRSDAEDIVQDAFLRLHRSESEDAVRSLKAYLTTITARLSLNRLRDRRARRETYWGEWLPEPLLTENQPTVRAEDVSFALLVVLERLSPLERVVFVLRNAFDLPFDEIAPMVDRDVVTCRKVFSRARTRVLEERPRFSVDRERHRAVMRGFVEAARGADMDQLVALLDDQVELHGDGGGKAPAIKKPIAGSTAVAQFVIALTRTVPPDAMFEEIELNGLPALIVAKADGQLIVTVMLEIDGKRIRSVYAVANPDKLKSITRDWVSTQRRREAGCGS